MTMATNENESKDALGEVVPTTARNSDEILSLIAKVSFSSIKTLNSPETQRTIKLLSEVSRNICASISPIVRFISEIDLSPIYEIVEILKRNSPAGVDYNELIERCMEVLYQYRWFPSSVYDCRIEFFFELVDILNSTRAGSKNRGRKIDALMFKYYDKQAIDDIKRDCRKNKDLDSCHKRLIQEALQAYQKGKYGTTVMVLTMLWQGMISLKVDNRVYQKDDKIRESMEKLVYVNGGSELYSDFFNTFIYYECSGFDKVKEDVPGRHGIAHSWIKKYPNKKTALNAILFTEFLVKLRPIKQDLQS